MFQELKNINRRPEPFEKYTADDLWTDPHTSARMLEYHLNEAVDAASRRITFIHDSVNWMMSHFGIGEHTDIADFGCGPGLYSKRLALHGAQVTGIDFSRNSIDYARQTADENGLDVDFVHGNYLSYETDRTFDLIIMIMCDFCALSPGQRKRLLEIFHRHLADDGVVVLDVYSLRAFAAREESATYERDQLMGFWSPGEYYGFVNIFKYHDEKVMCDKYTIVEEHRTREVYNWLQYYSRESLAVEFRACGFRIEEYFSDVAGKPYEPETSEFAVVAKKA